MSNDSGKTNLLIFDVAEIILDESWTCCNVSEIFTAGIGKEALNM
jgi:hypothetical protein